MQRTTSSATLSHRGFTLIELMVVIVILGLLFALVVVNPFRSVTEAQFDTTRMQMQSIAGAISMYRLKHHALPTSLADLTQRDPRTGQAFLEKLPKDAWGEPYDYRTVNDARGEYEIRSAGPDKVFGNDDDLRYPEPDDGSK